MRKIDKESKFASVSPKIAASWSRIWEDKSKYKKAEKLSALNSSLNHCREEKKDCR